MEHKKLVLFDFDGVLVNTVQISYNIHKEVNPSLTLEKYQELSNGDFEIETQKMAEQGKYTVPENYFEKRHAGVHKATIQEILRATIQSLSQKYKLYIVSSSPSSVVRTFLKNQNLEQCFVDIRGRDADIDKVVKFKQILSEENVTKDDCVFITDTLHDLEDANEVGIKSIAVTWGLHFKSNLEKGNPAKIIDNPALLEVVVEELFS